MLKELSVQLHMLLIPCKDKLRRLLDVLMLSIQSKLCAARLTERTGSPVGNLFIEKTCLQATCLRAQQAPSTTSSTSSPRSRPPARCTCGGCEPSQTATTPLAKSHRQAFARHRGSLRAMNPCTAAGYFQLTGYTRLWQPPLTLQMIKDMYELIHEAADIDDRKWHIGNITSGYLCDSLFLHLATHKLQIAPSLASESVSTCRQLIEDQIPVRKRQLLEMYGPEGRPALLPAAQPASASLAIGRVDTTSPLEQRFVELVNQNAFAVDVSGWRMAGGAKAHIKPGAFPQACI